MLNREVLKYILGFLCGESGDIAANIVYADNAADASAPIVMLRSSFFDDGIYGTPDSDPKLPLAQLNGVPILFGEPIIERRGKQVIIHADLVASTYYLISRYEEMIKPDIRDQHGRFPGRESLPYRAGFIDRPIIEEYGRILRDCLREVGVDVREPTQGFSHIYLTHDVDCPWEHFTLYTACKRILGELKRGHGFTLYPIKNVLGNPRSDPWYTFQTLLDADKMIPAAESVFFLKSTGHLPPQDYVPYIGKRGTAKLLQLLKGSGASLGYHVSYAAGRNTELVAGELDTLRRVCGEKITMSRNHYLASLEPRDYYALIESGITDDFTMGYADVAGFRLGTCRAVRWIDPEKKRLTELTLHPLEIMECTLTNEKYMALDEHRAQDYGRRLIESISKYGGELSLLWHNNGNIGREDSVDWKNYLFFLKLLRKEE